MEWPPFSEEPRVAFVTRSEIANWKIASDLIKNKCKMCEPAVRSEYASIALEDGDLVGLLYDYTIQSGWFFQKKKWVLTIGGFVVVQYRGDDFYVDLICAKGAKGGGKALLLQTTKFAKTARNPRTGLPRFRTISLSSVPNALEFYMRAAFVPGDGDPCNRGTWMAKRISARSGGYRFRKCLAEHSPMHWGPPGSGHPLPAKSNASAQTNQTSYGTNNDNNTGNSRRRSKRPRNAAAGPRAAARAPGKPRRRLMVVRPRMA